MWSCAACSSGGLSRQCPHVVLVVCALLFFVNYCVFRLFIGVCAVIDSFCGLQRGRPHTLYFC